MEKKKSIPNIPATGGRNNINAGDASSDDSGDDRASSNDPNDDRSSSDDADDDRAHS